MATYYIKATGTNTWPFNSLTNAATTIGDLFNALSAHSVTLGPTDTVSANGIITETDVYPGSSYIFNGALLTGNNPLTDQIYLSLVYIKYAVVRYLYIEVDISILSLMLWGCQEITHNRLVASNSTESGGNTCNLIYPATANNTITNNLIYTQNLQDGDDVDIELFPLETNIITIILENNTISLNDEIQITVGTPPHGTADVQKLYIRNNIFYNTSIVPIGFFNQLSGHSLLDFQHKNNIIYSTAPDYENPYPTPISPDVTEIVTDPLFIGSGPEPYALQASSPARHTGYHFVDSPTDDLLGFSRPNPPSRGAFEDLGSAPVINLQPLSTSKYIGQNVSFFADADGTPAVSYEWQFDSTPLINGGRISGADTTNLNITSLILGDAGYYSARAYNGIEPDATSVEATLTILSLLHVTYDGNGSTGGIVPVDSHNYNTWDYFTVMDKGSLVKTNCEFVHWNSSPDDLGNPYNPGDSVQITSNTTLYAIWQQNYIGGLIGTSTSDSTITNSYWDVETSGQADSSGGEGKTTAEMQIKSTYINWDFTSLWQLGDTTEYNFPRFLLTDFTADVTTGIAPFLVHFTNQSSGWLTDSSNSSFDWNFRDDSVDGTVMSPLHIFSKPGTYTISLKETRGAFSDTRIRLDYISLTTNAVNYYDNYPSRNDSTVISTIYLPILFPLLSGDSYFTQESQIGRVNLYFVHEDGWQKKRIVHIGTDLTGSAMWTSTAKTGTWFLTEIRVFDTDGAAHFFGRVNTNSDIIML
jgi:PKD repeat protein